MTSEALVRSPPVRALVASLVCAAALAGAGACSSGVSSDGAAAGPAATVTVTRSQAPADTPSADTPSADTPSAEAPASSAPGGLAVPTVSVPDLTDLPTGPVGGGSTSPSGSAGAVPFPTTAGATLPAGFPLPPGAVVGGVNVDGLETSGVVAVTDGRAAYDYWRTALPKAGYRVTHTDAAGDTYEIRLAGNGYSSDNSQIVIRGGQAIVQLDRE